MRKINRIICFIPVVMVFLFAACGKSTEKPYEKAFQYALFQDIPGVSDDEISAIQALQMQKRPFVYGMIHSAEAFAENSEIRGFSALLCEWLTDLFEIPFVPAVYEWGNLLEGLKDGTIDFSGDLTPVLERNNKLFMTDIIAMRPLKYFRLKDSPPVSVIEAERPPRLIFFDGSTSYNHVVSSKGLGSFEAVFVTDNESAYNLLKTGEADATVEESHSEAAYDIYGDIISEDYSSLIISPVAISTSKPELEPVISVITKALRCGATAHLVNLYNHGDLEYRKHKFMLMLDEEEKAYLQNTDYVPIAVQYFNYPIIFFDKHEKKWDGITFDLLHEAEKLTGLTFDVLNDERTEMAELMAMLNDGRAHMFSDLIFTAERDPYYLWAQYKYMSDQFALLSKIDFPNVNVNEIPYIRIALIKNTAHAEMFRTWFPGAVNTVVYDNSDDAFLALEKDEVDMVMAAKSKLLWYSNYYEFSGYKANYLFNYSYESALAFNKEQTILRNIMDKAFLSIDTGRFVDQWLTKTYDYQARLLAAQRPWLIGAIALSLIVFILTFFILLKSHKEKKKLAILTENTLESEKRLQILLDAMPISFHLINRDYEIFDCNQEAVNFVGAASKADLIKRYYDIFPEFQTDGQRTVDLRTEVLDKAFNDGWLRTECMHQSLDNDPVPLPSELTLIRFRHKGEDIIAACSRDLREQKAVIEEMHREGIIAEARSEAKSRFLAAMSHEIRTPMNSIMGFAELALNTLEIKTVPHLRSYFGKIIDSTKWLLKIINNILDVSKIESGSMELEKSPFDIYDVFLRCQSVILPDITEKGLELNVYAEPIPCKKLLGDPLRLYQALLNLLSNAVKFTDSGKITFSSLVRNMDDNKVTVYFEVKDTGIGMSSEQIEKIFDPFIQADSSTTRNYGGSGLGLTITKSIVELMGGKLSVESSPGIGSTFSFEIIFEAEDINIGYDPNHASLDVVEKPHFEGTILICDDNLLNQQVICEHLSNVGFKTVVVRNGKDGVDKVKSRMEKKERPFDLIFMDIFMPIMNGIEAAIKITELNTGTPIVALTANVMVSELEKYKKHGMSGFLGKPFTTQELWHILLQYLTPVNFSVIDKNHIAAEEEKLLMQLRLNFIKNNQTTFDDIKKAADAGDFALAKMIAHTLKGNAGQICEHGLKEAALRIENGEWGIEDMDVLKAELELVLEKLSPLLQEAASTQPAAADDEKTRELLEELEPMLISHNPLCINMLDEIRSIPGTGELVRHIEDFEFKQAILALEKFKKRGGQSNE